MRSQTINRRKAFQTPSGWDFSAWGSDLFCLYDPDKNAGSYISPISQMTDFGPGGRSLNRFNFSGVWLIGSSFNGQKLFNFDPGSVWDSITYTGDNIMWCTLMQAHPSGNGRLISMSNAVQIDYSAWPTWIPIYTLGSGAISTYRAGSYLSQALDADSWHIVVAVGGPGHIELWIDGAQVSGYRELGASAFNMDHLEIGSGVSSYFKGQSGLITAYTGAPSALQRQKAEGRIAHRYGFQGNLASDHPYKSTPP